MRSVSTYTMREVYLTKPCHKPPPNGMHSPPHPSSRLKGKRGKVFNGATIFGGDMTARVGLLLVGTEYLFTLHVAFVYFTFWAG